MTKDVNSLACMCMRSHSNEVPCSIYVHEFKCKQNPQQMPLIFATNEHLGKASECNDRLKTYNFLLLVQSTKCSMIRLKVVEF